MRDGLYESLITASLSAEIAASTDREARIDRVDVADEIHVLAGHVATAVARRLALTKDPDDRLTVVNEILRLVESGGGSVEPPTRELLAMYRPPGRGIL